MWVYIGPYRPEHQQVSRVTDTLSLDSGDLVAINCDWEGEPAIAESLQVEEDEVTVKWKNGTYSSAWTDPILLFAFKLTNKNHSRKTTILHLREAYSKLRQKQ